MTVVEMKGGSWEERLRSLSVALFPMSASWEISPGKQRGDWEKKEGVLCTMTCAQGEEQCMLLCECVYVCVCQGMAEIQSTMAGSEGLWKKQQHKCLLQAEGVR